MTDGLVWDEQPESLRRPVLVAGFEGWNDAADASSTAATWLTQNEASATRVATIDPEEHFDFQARRPNIQLVGGVTRELTWPENAFFTVRREERDLVVLRGVEPSYRWRSFSQAVLDVARSTNCELVVTLGALLADVPHTRTARVTGTSTDEDLVQRLGLASSRYEGPTGIVGVLHDACRAESVPSVSLWAPVPHYLAAPPNPPATLALLAARRGPVRARSSTCAASSGPPTRGARRSTRSRRPTRTSAATWRPSRSATTPEQGSDDSWGANLPTGDELATEVERFLREQRGEG